MYGIMKLQDHIMSSPDQGWRERYQAEGTGELGDQAAGPDA
jgi:hypothetical protein